MSEPRQAWNVAFREAQTEFPAISKTKTADMGNYSYKYADLGDVLAGVLPALHTHGLSLAQSPVSQDGRVGIETRIYHDAGHVEVFGPLFLPAGNTPQAAGSGLTYARRYAACAALGIVADEDDDGRAATVTSTPPSFDVAAFASRTMQIYTKWSEAERRQAWIDAVQAELGDHQPRDDAEGARVAKRVQDAYYAQFPPADNEAPF